MGDPIQSRGEREGVVDDSEESYVIQTRSPGLIAIPLLFNPNKICYL
jgi:hypothetical protein